jgi:hypothetical protein
MCYVKNQAANKAGRSGANGITAGKNRALAFLRRLLARIFVISGISVTLLHGHKLYEAHETERAAKTAERDQVLASSIQITMVDSGRIVDGVKVTQLSKGLGTLVEHDGQRYIMTHNHWALPETTLERVELRDADGRLLTVMARMSYLSLLRYSDAGTLLLAAPPELDAMPAAELGDSATLIIGAGLFIVTRDKQDENFLTVIEAEVEQAGGRKMPAQLLLRGPQTAVAPGDSGGGVWHDGRLVGNMWAIVESLQQTPWAWQGWFSSPIEPKPTGGYIVAEQPLDSAPVYPPFVYQGALNSGLLP